MNLTEKIIDRLKLEPLSQEGGCFRQSYVSSDVLAGRSLPERYSGLDHPACTAIYYLLTDAPDSFSAMHALLTDEVYHFYLGDPLELLLVHPDGQGEQILLGLDIFNGQCLQYVVPAGCWQGARVRPGGKFSLVGSTMAPGFTWPDFTLGELDWLVSLCPREAVRLRQLVR